MLFSHRGVDKSVVKHYNLELVDTPAPQALLNLYASCIGEKGVPVTFTQFVSVKQVKGSYVPANTRVSIFRVFRGERFYTGIATKVHLKAVRLRAHVSPACTDFLITHGGTLVSVVHGWELPVLFTCQYPTKALYRQYENVYEVAAKLLKFKMPPYPVPRLPGSPVVEAVYRAAASAKYPVTISLCGDGGSDVEKCTSEALLLVLDEHVATMLYAVNAKAYHPSARAASTSIPTVGEVEVGNG